MIIGDSYDEDSVYITSPEHRQTINIYQAHSGPVSGIREPSGVTGAQVVVGTVWIGFGGGTDGGLGGGGDGRYGAGNRRLVNWGGHCSKYTLRYRT